MEVDKVAPFTKSPLDAWRGTGRVAKSLGLTRQMTTGAEDYIKHVATITRSISPCPCGSKECNEYYAKSIKQRDQLETYPSGR
jgi:hypothetical protein